MKGLVIALALLAATSAGAFYYIVPPQADEIWKRIDELNETTQELNETLMDLNETVEEMEERVPDFTATETVAPGTTTFGPLPERCQGTGDVLVSVAGITLADSTRKLQGFSATGHIESSSVVVQSSCYDTNGFPCASLDLVIEVLCKQ